MSLTMPPPPRHGRAVLDPDQVREIAQHASEGLPHAEIAELYGVSVVTISHIATGKTWKGVSGVEPRKRLSRIGETERGEVLRLKADGMSGAEIASIMGCSEATVSRIVAHSRAAPE